MYFGTQKFTIIFKTAPARTSYGSGKSSSYSHIIWLGNPPQYYPRYWLRFLNISNVQFSCIISYKTKTYQLQNAFLTVPMIAIRNCYGNVEGKEQFRSALPNFSSCFQQVLINVPLWLGKLHADVVTWCEDEVSSPKCSVGNSEKLLHFRGNFTPLNCFEISDLKVYRTE